MHRYKCIVSYDGYNYMGFQIQEDLPTVELRIKEALYKMLGLDIKIYPSGRTDRYVHAYGQVFHFDLEQYIPEVGIQNGLNSYLPMDIHIKNVEIVDESFHARFSAKSKEYRYYICHKEYNPLTVRYAPYIKGLDINRMKEAIKLFEGVHDFKGFASASIDSRKDTTKHVIEVRVNEYDAYYEFVFVGTGFLKYQIRRMMGLLIEIGRKKENKEKILEVLEKKDPSISHKVADGCGLYLYKVTY